MEKSGQPMKSGADDLAFLYDFICECPNPHITEAMKKFVAWWLEADGKIPHLPTVLKEQLGLTNEETIEVNWLLAINPNTPPSVLDDLCKGGSSELLERIAENSRVASTTLASLSYQAVAEIRIAVASNPSTPLASIMILIKDDNPDVRFSIAENPKVPNEALEVLSKDENPYVRLRAVKTLDRLELEHKLSSAIQSSG